jgi:hypothetical protein
MTYTGPRISTYCRWGAEEYINDIRNELTPEERGVWADFMSKATLQWGYINFRSRESFAKSLWLTDEILHTSIEKFLTLKLIEKSYKDNSREIFHIVNWEDKQDKKLHKPLDDFLRSLNLDPDSPAISRSAEGHINAAENPSILEVKNNKGIGKSISKGKSKKEEKTCNKTAVYNPDIGPCCDSSQSRKGVYIEDDQEM